jgi:Polyketide cyclase / dehydrase and lipid transport
MSSSGSRDWHIVQTVELGAPATNVWAVVGGFFNIHVWHPDIQLTEFVEDQTKISPIRRLLTFPGQPKTTEQLLLMDNDDFHYRYKWYAGEWGEKVQNYVADIRVFDIDMGIRSIMQWASTFRCTEDAVSEFYQNGFRSLQKRFPLD